jgi:hypothetical protein
MVLAGLAPELLVLGSSEGRGRIVSFREWRKSVQKFKVKESSKDDLLIED